MGKKGGTDTAAEAKAAREAEAARQAKIREGTSQINTLFDGQFNDAFFDGRRDSFTNYALPQLNDQYGDALKQLTFALDRRGALDSSSRVNMQSRLERQRALQEQDIKSKALDYAGGARSDIEGSRAELIAALNATGDVESAVNGATARAKALSAVPAYSPLAAMFSDFTSTIGQEAAAQRAYDYSASPLSKGTSLYGAQAKSVKVR